MKYLVGIKIPEKLLLERITLKSITDGILAQLNLEKGLGYSIKKMTISPGEVVQEYLFEDRSRLTKPLALVLLVVAIATRNGAARASPEWLGASFFPTRVDLVFKTIKTIL